MCGKFDTSMLKRRLNDSHKLMKCVACWSHR